MCVTGENTFTNIKKSPFTLSSNCLRYCAVKGTQASFGFPYEVIIASLTGFPDCLYYSVHQLDEMVTLAK